MIEDLSNIAVIAPGNVATTPIQLELYGLADIKTSENTDAWIKGGQFGVSKI
ncbi:MAG TPA: hypothetical protein VKH62_17795 [Candidatus Binatia bacterium]|nr:hypothetical protein [Candidatus Binatia bacterium]